MDETKRSAADFLERVCRAMRATVYPVQRALTGNGRCFTSNVARQVYARHAVAHRTTRPDRPRTNGKAERVIQTLVRKWAYAATYAKSAERNAALREWIRWYNEQRPQASLDGCPPIQRLPNVSANDKEV
jgi:transposase InsO family protein